jgi:predicted TIM-barrel fold metal-dependent hydrolase
MREGPDIELDEPLVVVSCDAHVGPLLRAQLREYCPASHLERYDAFVAAHEAQQAAAAAEQRVVPHAFPGIDVTRIPGHHDPHAYVADMDAEGVAVEVLYHFSQNGEPMPFLVNPGGGLGAPSIDAMADVAVGYRMYNRWLADFVSVAPERFIGLAYLPMWDIDAAVRELEWAASAGLRGVNFPPPGRPGHLEYNNPAWEPFWSACCDLGMTLNTHSGNAAPFDYHSGPGGQDVLIFECGGWMARRAIWWLVHGRVFERHPALRLVITEQFEGWWTNTLAELDVVYARFNVLGRDSLPKPPSEYVREHVALGCSFLSRHLAEESVREGYATNVLWGRDYPHVEGTYHCFDGPAREASISRLSLRHAVSGLPPQDIARIAGENAVEVFGLDRAALREVAARIDAPTIRELSASLDELPPVRPLSNAFRGQANPRGPVPVVHVD